MERSELFEMTLYRGIGSKYDPNYSKPTSQLGNRSLRALYMSDSRDYAKDYAEDGQMLEYEVPEDFDEYPGVQRQTYDELKAQNFRPSQDWIPPAYKAARDAKEKGRPGAKYLNGKSWEYITLDELEPSKITDMKKRKR
jgi:hypothetical protein